MRITCFVLGTLCLLISAVWVGIGVLDLANGSSSTPTVANLRMTQAAVDTSQHIDDFGPASALAQIFAIAGIAWMIGAAAFAPRQAAPAATTEQRPWQPQQPSQPQYTPHWQQQAPSHQQAQPNQHPDQQS